MNNKEQKFDWHELEDIWISSSSTRNIHIQISQLIDEFKEHVSEFEKNTIKKDLNTLNDQWTQFKGGISQFEKDAINSDLNKIKKMLKSFLGFFKSKK